MKTKLIKSVHISESGITLVNLGYYLKYWILGSRGGENWEKIVYIGFESLIPCLEGMILNHHTIMLP